MRPSARFGKLYTITYYPQVNPNMEFREITVELSPDPQGKKFKIRARPGYKPRPGS